MLSKIRHYLPEEQIISLYHAIFSSHLSYGCQIWGQNEKSSLFIKISNLQKRALRIISFSRYDCPSEPIFKYYKILTLKDQISLYNCLLIHDYSRNLLPSSFDTFFTLCTELHNNDTRRQAGCVFVPHYSSRVNILAKSAPPRGGGINSTREKTGKKFSSREKVKN